MIKNVILINDFNYIQGGASKVAIETANKLAKIDGLNVYFFSGGKKEDSQLDKNVINICTGQGECLNEKNIIIGAINGIYNFKAKKKLKSILKKLDKNKTVVHVHGWTKCLSSSVFDICFKMNFKVVLTMHDYFTACPNGGYFNYKTFELCEYLPLSLKCIKCNCDSRNYAFKIYRIFRQIIQNKVVNLNEKVKNVISISNFSENILKKTLSEDTNIFRVDNPIDFDSNCVQMDHSNNKYYLYVGRVVKEKGVDIFCDAISDLNLKGIVVGDGDELEHLKKLYSKIDFVGWKNSSEVKKIMKKAKVLIFTSRCYEGSPLTTREALMQGLPCYVERNCAACEQVIEGENGFTFHGVSELKSIIMKDIKLNFQYNYIDNYIDSLLECYKKCR